MPSGRKNNVEPLALRVTPEVKRLLEDIADAEDRPIGYVARELMLRGLSLYHQDRILNPKVVEAKSELVEIFSVEDAEKLNIPRKKAS